MKTTLSQVNFNLLHVSRVQDITPHFRRVILTSQHLQDFPEDCRGDHIKLLIPQSRQTLTSAPTSEEIQMMKEEISERSIKRIYTVAEFNAQNKELSVDFVLHGDNGPASAWATNAAKGDAIGVIAPRGRERFVLAADWFLLIGDLSGLAALKAVIKTLSTDAQGYAFLEVESASDIQQIKAPKGLTIKWLVRNHPNASKSRLLFDAVKSLVWQQGKLSVTLAGESEQVVLIRKYLRTEKNVSHDMMYAVPYWKDKCNEDQYHDQRHKAMADLN